jgi:hypothetical protein
MFRKALATLGVVAALTFIPTTAFAHNCYNASRAPYTGTDYVQVTDPWGNPVHIHFAGKWIYVLEEGVWIFLPERGVPNGVLLSNGVCSPGNPGGDARQTTHGIQLFSGC